MSLGKQAKVLSKKQIEMISQYLRGRRCGLRNQVIFLLSVKAGLRAKETARLRSRLMVRCPGSGVPREKKSMLPMLQHWLMEGPAKARRGPDRFMVRIFMLPTPAILTATR